MPRAFRHKIGLMISPAATDKTYFIICVIFPIFFIYYDQFKHSSCRPRSHGRNTSTSGLDVHTTTRRTIWQRYDAWTASCRGPGGAARQAAALQREGVRMDTSGGAKAPDQLFPRAEICWDLINWHHHFHHYPPHSTAWTLHHHCIAAAKSGRCWRSSSSPNGSNYRRAELFQRQVRVRVV